MSIDKITDEILKKYSESEDVDDALMKMEAKIEQLKEEIEKLKLQQAPCSTTCYQHQTHPCEQCGRINGYLPSVWEVLEGGENGTGNGSTGEKSISQVNQPIL